MRDLKIENSRFFNVYYKYLKYIQKSKPTEKQRSRKIEDDRVRGDDAGKLIDSIEDSDNILYLTVAICWNIQT